jgi:CTD small phosphatase-like protein 2
MARIYEVIVFTASNSCYADVVLDHLDPHYRLISHRLYRESCMPTPNGMFIKDLRVIGGRDLEDMVLVDNASYSFGQQLENGIPIVPFYDSKQDVELMVLGKYLERLAKAPSMKEVNKKTFRLREISECASVEEAYHLLSSN